ncbi:MAG TPA: nitroreductase family protein [Bacteroidales bacterium]|nr:nitroreductase family protein [Bacteroidales bacterium]
MHFCIVKAQEMVTMNKIKDDHIKMARPDYPIMPLIAGRWSPRAFDGRPVENEKLQRIFEAARWAPSSSNEQPWRFIVGFKGDEVYDKIFSTLVEFNRLWAGTAPVLFLAIAKTSSGKNPEKMNKAATYDLGQAMAYLTLQAMNEGLYVHQMGGFDVEMAGELFDLPVDYKVVTANTIGYIGNPDMLHPNLKVMENSPRERKPLSAFVFGQSLGQPASFL